MIRTMIAAPTDIATCMYYAGVDPMTRLPVAVGRAMRDRKLQRPLLQ